MEAPTFGSGTSHLPAFSFRFCLMVLLNTLARSTCKCQQGNGVRHVVHDHSVLHAPHYGTSIPACASQPLG